MAVDEGILVVSHTLNQEAVMADDQRSRVQKVFEDGQIASIVAWLVQYWHVWLFQKNAQQCQTPALATGGLVKIGKLGDRAKVRSCVGLCI